MRDPGIEKCIPPYIWDICHRFYEAGEDAYIVGGSLRDILLGRTPSDFDLATSALPKKTAELFSDMRVIETGIKHGTVTVIAQNSPVEITTFRVDGGYTDSRHPDRVSFTCRIEEDLGRRDFTVNAMAYNDRSGLVDPYGGLYDLKARIIRAVGDSKKRFSEDALRIMRAFRFSAQLEFEIDPDTLSGAVTARNGLKNIAKERISSEFLKTLTTRDPEYVLRLMAENDILTYITNGYIPMQEIFPLVKKMPCDGGARLGLLMYGADEKLAKDILRSLKVSNAIVTLALSVIRHSTTAITTPAHVRRLIGQCGPHAIHVTTASSLLGISCADAPKWAMENNAPCSISDLALSGNDLISLGIHGKNIGETLSYLLECVINDPSLNDRKTLLDITDKYLKNGD